MMIERHMEQRFVTFYHTGNKLLIHPLLIVPLVSLIRRQMSHYNPLRLVYRDEWTLLSLKY